MPYAMQYDVPASREMYNQVRAAIGAAPPDGLIVQLVFQTDQGLRHVGVWESEDHWLRFHQERSKPAVAKMLSDAGFSEMPPDPAIEELELVDVWTEPRS